jgi:PRC-barrel domain
MSIHIDEVLDWRGRAVVDRDGQKIGTFDEIYLDEGTNEPAWAAVKTGLFKLRRRVVPISAAEPDGDHVRVPFTKDQVQSAPTIDSDGWVPESDQAAILHHYGLSGAESRTGTSSPTSGEGSDAGDRPPNRVKLKRYTVTETLTRRSEFGPD